MGLVDLTWEKILIVDDEEIVLQILEHYLKREGYVIFRANNGVEAIQAVYEHTPDLVLLDVLMPEMDGIGVCQEIRKYAEIPILFVTSKDESLDLAQGFGAGADDYIKKPFDPVEVVIRVKAHLRRYRHSKDFRHEKHKYPVLEFSGLKIDLGSRTVEVNENPINLTKKEFDLLTILAENANRYFTTDQLVELVWNSPESVDQRSLMVHISNLRKKIEPDPACPTYIVSLRGVGYKFNT